LDYNSKHRVSPYRRHNLLSHHTDRRVLEMDADISDNDIPMATAIPRLRHLRACEISDYALRQKVWWNNKCGRTYLLSIPRIWGSGFCLFLSNRQRQSPRRYENKAPYGRFNIHITMNMDISAYQRGREYYHIPRTSTVAKFRTEILYHQLARFQIRPEQSVSKRLSYVWPILFPPKPASYRFRRLKTSPIFRMAWVRALL